MLFECRLVGDNLARVIHTATRHNDVNTVGSLNLASRILWDPFITADTAGAQALICACGKLARRL